MKWKAIIIILIIIASLFPVYLANKHLQKVIAPRRSLIRLFLYLLLGLVLVFAYTFLVVFVVKKIFPGA